MLAMLVDVQWHLNSLHLHFPNDNETDHLFMCYLPIVHIFFVKFLLTILLIVLFLLKSSILYIF